MNGLGFWLEKNLRLYLRGDDFHGMAVRMTAFNEIGMFAQYFPDGFESKPDPRARFYPWAAIDILQLEK